MGAHNPGAVPVSSGQAAFATIAEVVAILKADSTTDWSKVNIEALRRHLIDMDDVVMHAALAKRDVPGGMEATVTGTGNTVAAIRRMLAMHSMALNEGADYRAATAEVPNGIRFTVTAKDRADVRQVARIRGLGFAGLLTEGDHHARHHLAIARGDDHPHGR
jgi:hypothetical protein